MPTVLKVQPGGCPQGLSAHAVPTSNSISILSARSSGPIQATGDSAHQPPSHVSCGSASLRDPGPILIPSKRLTYPFWALPQMASARCNPANCPGVVEPSSEMHILETSRAQCPVSEEVRIPFWRRSGNPPDENCSASLSSRKPPMPQAGTWRRKVRNLHGGHRQISPLRARRANGTG